MPLRLRLLSSAQKTKWSTASDKVKTKRTASGKTSSPASDLRINNCRALLTFSLPIMSCKDARLSNWKLQSWSCKMLLNSVQSCACRRINAGVTKTCLLVLIAGLKASATPLTPLDSTKSLEANKPPTRPAMKRTSSLQLQGSETTKIRPLCKLGARTALSGRTALHAGSA